MPFPVSTIKDQDNSGGTIVTGSHDVFCNGLPVATVGSKVRGWLGHYQIVEASATVFVNGLPKACVKSITNADTKIVTGSPDVFVE